MKTTILWVVGEPGVGKTTLVRKLLGDAVVRIAKPKWTVALHDGLAVCAAGHYTGDPFDGADTVPYNAADEALEYWLQTPTLHECNLTIFDGDRFSNKKVVEYFSDMLFEYRIAAILLSGEPELIARRRAERGEQDPNWVKGRVTKARNFFELFEDRIEISGNELEMLAKTKEFLKGATKLKTPVKTQGSFF